ncbi:hypothetical protein GEV33_004549 [Tenebrio molitor]|uniref:SWIM-type domain-containing protein n=1 Tax=Tenebrio molitor TaxID=7067 RepID=A0A8J6LFK4_TENMO|nr:hypothetical protein GEV33_004549 [Tenebrio molitor]
MNYLSRGENAYTSAHVQSVTFDGNVEPVLLKGVVQASMKKRAYNVEVAYNPREGVKKAYCTCPRGEVICHHMAALLYHGHYNISATDTACQWKIVQTPPETAQPVKLSDLFTRKNQNYRATKRDLSASEITTFAQALGPSNVVGFSWLLRAEPTVDAATRIPNIEDIIFSEEYLAATDKQIFILERSQVSKETILEIEKLTRGQHLNSNWHLARKHRLTASKFGLVLSACRRNRYPPSLLKNLMEGYSLDRVAAVQWGKQHKGTALGEFKAATGLSFEPSGLWLHPCGLLGASPDGVGEDFVIEVKCPYKFRNAASLKDVVDKNYCFWYEGDVTVVNTNHQYYHQVQGQLHLLDKAVCYMLDPNGVHSTAASLRLTVAGQCFLFSALPSLNSVDGKTSSLLLDGKGTPSSVIAAEVEGIGSLDVEGIGSPDVEGTGALNVEDLK